MPIAQRFRPGPTVNLAALDPGTTPGPKSGDLGRDDAERELAENVAAIDRFHNRLWAERRRALLVILQGMDAAGKDGAIRNVFGPLNPRGCRVVNFRKPSEEELEHDFLWRVHAEAPARGTIGVFNRSHYEDVLVVRVNGLVAEPVWRARFDLINGFEAMLTSEGTRVLKFFLHISKSEQKERLQERLNDPEKHWKFQPGDLDVRRRWDDYRQAYEDVLTKCSTEAAPWYIIPADRKWYRNWAISTIVRETLEGMDPQIPAPLADVSQFKID